jgi:hypothetical protein
MPNPQQVLEKLVKNLGMELQTVDVLIAHVLADLRGSPDAPHLNAARRLCETIQILTATYK